MALLWSIQHGRRLHSWAAGHVWTDSGDPLGTCPVDRGRPACAETALRRSAKNSIRIHYLYILAPHLHFESLHTTPARLHYPRAISLLNSVSGQEIASKGRSRD